MERKSSLYFQFVLRRRREGGRGELVGPDQLLAPKTEKCSERRVK